jgi:F0F1-type ATP synthase assembly protein I
MSDRAGKGPREPEPWASALGRYSGYGLQLALSVGLFMAAGWWVDGKLGTKPLVTIVAVLVGGGAAFYRVYLQLVKSQEDADS